MSRGDDSRHQHVEISGSNINIGEIINGPKVVNPPPTSGGALPKTVIQRNRLEPVMLAGHPLRTWYIIAAGAIGLLAGLAEIGAFLAPTDDSPAAAWLDLLVMSAGAGIGSLGVVLHGTSYIKMPGLMIEKDNRHRIYRTGVTGTCGLCQNRHSTIRLSGFGPGGNKPTMIICNRNPQQHRLVFDPTVLPEIEEDLRELRS